MFNLADQGQATHPRHHRRIQIIHVTTRSGRNEPMDHHSAKNTKNESIHVRRVSRRDPSLSQVEFDRFISLR